MSIRTIVFHGATSPTQPSGLLVTLMGKFRTEFVPADSNAASIPIANAAWPRPAAKRLLIYFALNMGRPIPRDQILNDLWPNSAPSDAQGSFKTIFSLLRKVLESDLPPKSPSRFFSVDQQTYAFNTHNNAALARTDLSTFERIVTDSVTLQTAHDAAPPPQVLLEGLAAWQPLAPEIAHETWAIETGERTLDMYAQACIRTASAFADLARPADAAHWAERATQVVPWSEEAWQLAIRARAHMGDKARALALSDAASAALNHELGAPPSALLVWLAQRLRTGHEI